MITPLLIHCINSIKLAHFRKCYIACSILIIHSTFPDTTIDYLHKRVTIVILWPVPNICVDKHRLGCIPTAVIHTTILILNCDFWILEGDQRKKIKIKLGNHFFLCPCPQCGKLALISYQIKETHWLRRKPGFRKGL